MLKLLVHGMAIPLMYKIFEEALTYVENHFNIVGTGVVAELSLVYRI